MPKTELRLTSCSVRPYHSALLSSSCRICQLCADDSFYFGLSWKRYSGGSVPASRCDFGRRSAKRAACAVHWRAAFASSRIGATRRGYLRRLRASRASRIGCVSGLPSSRQVPSDPVLDLRVEASPGDLGAVGLEHVDGAAATRRLWIIIWYALPKARAAWKTCGQSLPALLACVLLRAGIDHILSTLSAPTLRGRIRNATNEFISSALPEEHRT